MATGSFTYLTDESDNARCSQRCPRYRCVYAPDTKEFLEYCVLFPDAIDRQRGAECLAAEQHAKELFAAIAAKDAA